MKNYGLNLKLELEQQSDADWKFGSISEDLAQIPEEERINYLPKDELQKGLEETFACASYSPLNLLEMKFNYLLRNKKLSFENQMWLNEKGYIENGKVNFSDRYTAVKSGTTEEGNSLIAPLNSIRKDGIIPESLLPKTDDMTFAQFHNKEAITGVMEMLGKDFASRFFINYEKVLSKDYPKALKKDMIGVAGYAWPEPIGGEYPRVEAQPNHAFMLLKTPPYFIYDSYPDTYDGDFIKKLASDYSFLSYGYRLSVNQKAIIPVKPLSQKFKEWLDYHFPKCKMKC